MRGGGDGWIRFGPVAHVLRCVSVARVPDEAVDVASGPFPMEVGCEGWPRRLSGVPRVRSIGGFSGTSRSVGCMGHDVNGVVVVVSRE